MILWILGLSILSGICYRLGGKEGYNTKIRDLGIPCVATVSLLILGIKVVWWAYVLHFGLFFGALTTYRYFLPKPTDYEWWHYGLHGLMIGLAATPLIWSGVHWYSIVLRAIALAGFMAVWYFLAKWNDDLHEGGRGGSIIASLLILLI